MRWITFHINLTTDSLAWNYHGGDLCTALPFNPLNFWNNVFRHKLARQKFHVWAEIFPRKARKEIFLKICFNLGRMSVSSRSEMSFMRVNSLRILSRHGVKLWNKNETLNNVCQTIQLMTIDDIFMRWPWTFPSPRANVRRWFGSICLSQNLLSQIPIKFVTNNLRIFISHVQI